MTELDNSDWVGNGNLSGEVHHLAARALAVLAKQRTPQPFDLSEHIHQLAVDFCELEPNKSRDAIDTVLGQGVTTADVIDHLLPTIARHLGDQWFADAISFADVSIGTARLQETIRRLRARERGSAAFAPGLDARVLLIVPSAEEHTLGVFVAADQLRRRGIAVELSIHERRVAIAERIRTTQYKMVGITASGVRTIASVKELVDTVRKNARQFVPIVLGGPLAEADERVRERANVDIIGTDIRIAALRCGLLPTGTDTSEKQV